MIDLYDLTLDGKSSEGVIRLHDDGEEITNQTGGLACNHPVVRGTFYACPIPQALQDHAYEYRCQPSDEKWLERANEILIEAVTPAPDGSSLRSVMMGVQLSCLKIVGGEEAWLEAEDYDGNKFILTWENSD
jgi:hypothetical protein